MNWYSRLSLKTKFVLVTSLVVVILCAGFYFVTERIFKSYLQSEMMTQASEVGGSLNEDLTTYLGPDAVQESADRFLTERREISRIVVYQRMGIYFQPVVKAQTTDLPDTRDLYKTAINQRSPLRFEFNYKDKEYWEFAYPRVRDDAVVGLTAVTLNFSQYKAVMSAVRTGTLLILISGLIVMLVTTNIYVEVAIRRPLAEIVSGMDQVKRTRFDTRIHPHSQDEIGKLAEDFNGMTLALGEAQEEIVRQNRMLEMRVREATSELRSRNVELFQAQDELRRANRLATAGQVAAMLAHELGSPLSSISGHLQLMLENTVYPDVEKQRLHLILSQVERLSDTIRNFLNNVTGLESHFVSCDLNEVLQHMIQLTTPVFMERQIEPLLELDPRIPLVEADSNQLEQLLLNLFTNAIDAMKDGGRLIAKTAFISSSSPEISRFSSTVGNVSELNGVAVLVIEDTGPGIEPDHVKSLFRPFFSTKEFGRGAGLGLTICKEIVKAHGGQIVVDSDPGKGTRFTIALPVRRPVARDAVPALEGATPVPAGGSGG